MRDSTATSHWNFTRRKIGPYEATSMGSKCCSALEIAKARVGANRRRVRQVPQTWHLRTEAFHLPSPNFYENTIYLLQLIYFWNVRFCSHGFGYEMRGDEGEREEREDSGGLPGGCPATAIREGRCSTATATATTTTRLGFT